MPLPNLSLLPDARKIVMDDAPHSARDLLFGGLAAGTSAPHLGLLLLRIFAGLALAFAHGLGKVPPGEGFVGMLGGIGVPAPGLAAWFSSFAEFFGGLLLATGLLTRPAAALIVINMLVAIFTAHAGQPFGKWELALLYASIALCFVFTGAGRYGLDALLRRERD